MPIKIQIAYPQGIASEDLDVLKKHEAELKGRLVTITEKTYEKYEWVPSDKKGCFSLICVANKEVVCIESIKKIASDDFVGQIESEHVFRAARKRS